MLLLPKNKKRSFFKRILEKRNSFIRSETFSPKKALNFLNIAQFLGVINDNVFKFLTVFLLIDIKGIEQSSSILFWVGTVYVLPFLFFSSAAGVLADKFSKQKIIVALKGVEVLTTALAIFAFWLESAWACYALLFLLSLHSAAFGPPKYSIIPEIVHEDKISKANGLITSFTYLGIIVGTFLASFTTQITGKNFALCAGVCLVIAILGFGASLLIPYTKPNRTTNKIKFFFLKEIYKTLEFCYKTPHLLISVLSAAFFLYLGAFFQLNIIPYAIQSLGLSEVGGGYLFLTVAIGIAIGAVLVGKLSKNNIELGFSCIAGIVLFFLVFLLAILPKNIPIDVILLILVGCFSGFFIVPFDAYIQKYSPDEKRGQIVATSNFMSFCGVLMAPFSIYFLSGALNLTAAQGFFIVSLFVLGVGSTIALKLSSIFFNGIGKHLYPLIYSIRSIKPPFEKGKPQLLILPAATVKKMLTLFSCSEKIEIFILRNSFKPVDLFLSMFSTIHVVYTDTLGGCFSEVIQEKTKPGYYPCIALSQGVALEKLYSNISASSLKKALYVKVDKLSPRVLMERKIRRDVLLSFHENLEISK